MIGLFINIPFYSYVNNYISKESLLVSDQKEVENYLEHLIKEISTYRGYFDHIKTIYIGGGIPSSLSTKQLERLFKSIELIKPIEFNIEVEPDSLTIDKIKLLSKYKVNRIVLKIDTFNDNLLNILGKKYNYNDIVSSINDLRSHGFNNINLDLKFSISKQTITDIKSDLRQIKKLKIPHISYYDLDIDEHSNLYNTYNFDRDLSIKMFEIIIKELKKSKYEHYEISHFAKNNLYSLHNILYWTLEEYIGCGLGSHGFINNIRTINNNDLNDYYKTPLKEKIPQSKEDNIQNYLIYGLSLIRGINLADFKNKYKIDIIKRYPKLQFFIENDILKVENGNLQFTDKGIFYSTEVFEVFI